MINVKKISKIYKSDDSPVFALNNVSLSLPDKGMVFIVGKSGSGKSTLLNVLAGFDTPSKGNVFFGKTNINKLSATELDYYRNSIIGFVFQDYCLIETFTVKQNIDVAFDYKKEKKSNDFISKILDSVGLKGFENRYPRQLSAGQKQRVAIARALAKDSKVILADEPTGNLDSKTTAQILDLLKTISKNRLVVVVSHSKEDALLYGDRIIEISNGKIASDRKKNDIYNNEFSIEGNVINLPNKKRLSEEELSSINEIVKKEKGNVSFVRSKEKFDSHTKEYAYKSPEIQKTRMGFKNLLKYSWLFFKNQLFSFFLVVFIVTFLITTLSLSLQFGTYDGKKQYEEAIASSQSTTLVLHQDGTVSEEELPLQNASAFSGYMFEVDEKNSASLKEKHKHKSYNLYNFYLPLSNNGPNSTYLHNYYGVQSRLGTINNLLECDIQYIYDTFKDDAGNLNYIGEISPTSDGIIITNLIADFILNITTLGVKFYDYYDILETDYFYKNYGVKICAIIETPFTYKKLISGELKDSYEKESDFLDALVHNHFLGYTINPFYYEQYKENIKNRLYSFPVAKQTFSTLDGKQEYSRTSYLALFSSSVKEGEIILSYSYYNEMFGTDCTAQDKSDFVKQHIIYKAYDFKNNIYVEKTLFVSSLGANTYLSPSMRSDITNNRLYKIGEYATNVSNKGGFYIDATKLGFKVRGTRTELVKTVVECVAIFKDMFKLLSVIMVVSIVVLIVVNTINIMSRNMYNIGVSRSLGAHLGELGFIYSLQMVAFGVLVIILSSITNYYSLEIINDILSENIPKVLGATGIEDFVYLYYDPSLASAITGTVVFLTIVSIFVPILSIKMINPVNIIKKKP